MQGGEIADAQREWHAYAANVCAYHVMAMLVWLVKHQALLNSTQGFLITTCLAATYRELPWSTLEDLLPVMAPNLYESLVRLDALT